MSKIVIRMKRRNQLDYYFNLILEEYILILLAHNNSQNFDFFLANLEVFQENFQLIIIYYNYFIVVMILIDNGTKIEPDP